MTEDMARTLLIILSEMNNLKNDIELTSEDALDDDLENLSGELGIMALELKRMALTLEKFVYED